MEGIYVISVAARILEMHPQTLRKYERVGFVSPSRTGGKLRLYSEQDIVRLRLIKHLTGELGLNIAGVQLALALFNQMLKMKVQLDRLQGPALKRALKLDGSHADTWFLLAKVHHALENLDEARQAIQQAMSLQPDQENYESECLALQLQN